MAAQFCDEDLQGGSQTNSGTPFAFLQAAVDQMRRVRVVMLHLWAPLPVSDVCLCRVFRNLNLRLLPLLCPDRC